MEPVLPLVPMVAILLIIGAVVGGTPKSIASVGLVVMFGVVLHNGIGLLGGCGAAVCSVSTKAVCRTLAIEVGMQNSRPRRDARQAVFHADRRVAGRLVLGSGHNLSGSLLAGFWAGRPAKGSTHANDERAVNPGRV